MSRRYAGCGVLILLLGVAGCTPGWFAQSSDGLGGDWTAEVRPASPVIGQPFTVMGYCSVPRELLTTTLVRIQLSPAQGFSNHRLDIGTASLDTEGRFSWSDTLRPNYGGIAITASQSYQLYPVLAGVRPKGSQATVSLDSLSVGFTPLATSGP